MTLFIVGVIAFIIFMKFDLKIYKDMTLTGTIGYFVGKLLGIIFHGYKKGMSESERDRLLREADEKQFPQSISLATVKDFSDGFDINNPYRGVLIIGGAGSGKTETFVKTTIEQGAMRAFSGIIYDYKYPSLTKMYYNIAKTYSDKIKLKQYIINFDDPQQSHRVNPLHPSYLKTVAYAEEFASTIIGNLMPETIKKPDFWTRSATALLQASIWYFKEHYPEQCNLPNVVNFIQQPTSKVLTALRKDELCAQLISSILTAFDNKAEGQLSGTVGTLQIALNKINTPEIAYILSGNDFSLDLNDPKDPKMLCIGNSPQMQETYSPVISLICTVALKMMNQDGKHHSMLLLDEAPTLYIPKLEAVPATGRERKIAVFYIAQDISQIVDRYGKEKKDTIIANLANQFWGRVSHHETAEHISRIFGKHEVYRESRTYAGQHVSRTESLVDKEVLKASEVYNFTPGTFAYVIVDWRGRNIKGVKKFYYENNILTYGNDPIILTDKEIDVTKTYNELKREVREILDKNIVEENKKVEHKNKNNSNELF